MTTDTDAERKARAIAWLELWRKERDKARAERRPMRYITYDYAPAAQQRAGEGGEEA